MLKRLARAFDELPKRSNGRYRNTAEEEFCRRANKAGWSVSKRGWPDFFMERDGEIACVEVKRDDTYSLKPYQRHIMERLASYGVPCYLWNPENGFERIGAGGVPFPK